MITDHEKRIMPEPARTTAQESLAQLMTEPDAALAAIMEETVNLGKPGVVALYKGVCPECYGLATFGVKLAETDQDDSNESDCPLLTCTGMIVYERIA